MGQVSSSKSSTPMDGLKVQQPPEIKVIYDGNQPRFSVQNAEEIEQGVEYLNEHGYAIFSNVLSNDEASHGIDLLWKFLENLKEPYNIERNDPETWDELWPGSVAIGLLNNLGIGQSEFLWFVRGNPNVKKVFSRIWDSNELFVSFDGAGCFRNWHINKEWKTRGGWYHCDQNPFKKPTRCSIQGLVSLTDSDETTGGLVVVPGSHKHFLDLKSTMREERLHGDFAQVPYQYPLLQELSPQLIRCKAGDLVVWDSRSIHCNTPALVYKEKANPLDLLRVVTYICMSPLSMFVPNANEFETLEEFRRLREDCIRNGITCTHWPLELVCGSRGSREKETPLKLNAFQHSLVIGTNVEADSENKDFIF